jgi:hypothetical protein
VKPRERIESFFDRFRKPKLVLGGREVDEERVIRRSHSIEIKSEDGSRRFVFLNFSDAAFPHLSIELQKQVGYVELQRKTAGRSWAEVLGVSVFKVGEELEYGVHLDAWRERQGVHGEKVQYKTNLDNQMAEPNMWFRLMPKRDESSDMTIPELPLKADLPETINIGATVKSFLEQVHNLDFTDPKLITDDSFADLPLMLETVIDLLEME